jgi:DNA replication protein DnaC
MLCESCIAQYRCRKNKPVYTCDGYIILSEALKMAQIPSRYANATLNTYINDNRSTNRIIKFIKYLREYPSTNLVITGNVGTGKTYSACVILNEFIIDNCLGSFNFEEPLGLFANYSMLMARIKNSYSHEDDMLSQYMNNIYNVPLLVLDDVGATALTEHVKDLSLNIFDTRYAFQRSTIITSNLSLEELTIHLGERIMSRLMENSSAIVFNGVNRRRSL